MTPPVEALEMFVEFVVAGRALTFTLNREVTGGPALEFRSQDAADAHPLAASLMAIDGVRRVALGPTDVAISCDPDEDLEEVAARAELAIRRFFEERG